MQSRIFPLTADYLRQDIQILQALKDVGEVFEELGANKHSLGKVRWCTEGFSEGGG